MDDETDLDQLSEPAKAETTRGMTPEEKASAIVTSGKLIRKGVFRASCLAIVGSLALALMIVCLRHGNGPWVAERLDLAGLWAMAGLALAALFYLLMLLNLSSSFALRRSVRADLAEGVVLVARGVACTSGVRLAEPEGPRYVRAPDALPAPGTPVECVVGPHSGLVLSVRAIAQNEIA